MTRTALKPATVLAGFVLAISGSIEADSSDPSVATYATGLTNPRGLTFGPDGHLYCVNNGGFSWIEG